MKIFKQSVVKWLMIALCLCLTGCSLGKNAADSPAADSPLHDIGFEFENIRYGTIGFEERIRYGLVDSGEISLTPENTYKITQKDLGEKMGTVELPYGNGTESADVYHFAAYPDYDSICIVDTPDGYVFYCDGEEVSRCNAHVSQVPQFILLTTEVQGYRSVKSGKMKMHGGDGEADTPPFVIKGEFVDDAFVVDFVRVFDRVE